MPKENYPGGYSTNTRMEGSGLRSIRHGGDMRGYTHATGHPNHAPTRGSGAGRGSSGTHSNYPTRGSSTTTGSGPSSGGGSKMKKGRSAY